jgi:hypothetical protein
VLSVALSSNGVNEVRARTSNGVNGVCARTSSTALV